MTRNASWQKSGPELWKQQEDKNSNKNISPRTRDRRRRVPAPIGTVMMWQLRQHGCSVPWMGLGYCYFNSPGHRIYPAFLSSFFDSFSTSGYIHPITPTVRLLIYPRYVHLLSIRVISHNKSVSFSAPIFSAYFTPPLSSLSFPSQGNWGRGGGKLPIKLPGSRKDRWGAVVNTGEVLLRRLWCGCKHTCVNTKVVSL